MRDEPVAVRRTVFAALAGCAALGLLWLCWRALAPGGWTVWEAAILLAFAGTLPWSAIGVANAAIGLALLLWHRDPPGAVMPQLRAPPVTPPLRTALVACVRNEAMDAVLPPLVRLLDGLEAAGEGGRFILWVLSDTQDPAHAAREEAAVAALAAARAGRACPVRYRRRAGNAGYKAGNVMEFLDRHAAGLDLFLCLDADSEMSPAAVLRLRRCMEADPRLAIVQPLIVGRPARAAFPRLFQFGMRAGMRAWATGQAWWQGDEGPYWGHNAMVRIVPFREHARLETLPDGRAILSHDQLESVRLQAAGWKVRALPVEEGSLEANPPALPDFLARDLRWGEGNMQYGQLLRLPGLRPMGRWQLLQAILLFLGAPLWVLILLAAVLNVLTGGAEATPRGALALLLGLGWVAYHAPKLAGYLEVLLKPRLAAAYGGRARFAGGALAEIAFTLFLEPISLLNKARLLVLLPFGWRGGWRPQQRADRGVSWGDAWRLLWPQTLLGLGGAGLLAAHSAAPLLWALPFLAGPVLAVPFCVLTAEPGLSRALERRGIAATPEELAAGLSCPGAPAHHPRQP
ncbi:glucans biosynthesis glucosyltransferase MdoH [Roseomonas sp. OT10]|uniref:glucans biosynthesis glucosyltransferase MdoH n=1 Tax=Roseomonas cutis TaxID=2897332 RepID=UPI001E5A7CBD|nr:glucans biosynthesis glucosyltransferase MdoH [Roseomonas sp. OT10]UFN48988.1 glucans biosynthesis glucosyltransferase MdoH [Roseomonas sp. OT10]